MASPSREAFFAYRIADRRRKLFDGTGSFINGNRWNSPGRRVIYAAQTYAGALLETLVHASFEFVPKQQSWIRIEIPEQAEIEAITTGLIPGWNSSDLSATRRFGDQWHEERRTPVLLVPSVVTAGVESNVLLNQDHPRFSLLTASDPAEVAWDLRLIRG